MALVKKFNLLAAVVTATFFAGAFFQVVVSATDTRSSWVLGATWVAAAVVWAIGFSLVRDGVQSTLSVLRRR